jgi:hypothetical protein
LVPFAVVSIALKNLPEISHRLIYDAAVKADDKLLPKLA